MDLQELQTRLEQMQERLNTPAAPAPRYTITPSAPVAVIDRPVNDRPVNVPAAPIEPAAPLVAITPASTMPTPAAEHELILPSAFVTAAKIALLFTTPDKVRAVLRCVRFDHVDGALRMTATDSYALGYITVPMTDAFTGTFTIDGDDLKLALNALGKHKLPTVRISERDVTFTGEHKHTCRRAEVDFPRCDGIMPTGVFTPCKVAFGGAMLERVGKAARMAGDAVVKYEGGVDALKPHVFTATASTMTLTVVQMPVRLPS